MASEFSYSQDAPEPPVCHSMQVRGRAWHPQVHQEEVTGCIRKTKEWRKTTSPPPAISSMVRQQHGGSASIAGRTLMCSPAGQSTCFPHHHLVGCSTPCPAEPARRHRPWPGQHSPKPRHCFQGGHGHCWRSSFETKKWWWSSSRGTSSRAAAAVGGDVVVTWGPLAPRQENMYQKRLFRYKDRKMPSFNWKKTILRTACSVFTVTFSTDDSTSFSPRDSVNTEQ